MFNPKDDDMRTKRAAIENQLNRLMQEIHEVDRKIRFYLSDRQNNPHPRHHEFIEKVQRYRIDPSSANRHLETLLDNLQWKAYYYQRAWNQMWENADAAYRQGRTVTIDTPPSPEQAQKKVSEIPKNKSQYSIESLWDIQLEKLKIYGTNVTETKEDFKHRMYGEYQQLSKNKKTGQEIVMTYDIQEQKCKLSLKD